jgi:cytochrome P450
MTTLRSVPTAPGRRPVLGHLGPLLTRRLAFVRSLRAHGDVVRIYFGPRPVYAVTGPAVLRDLLVDHGRDFDKGSIFDKGKAFLGEGLITSAGDLHRRQRRMIQPAFHQVEIERYVPVMREAAADLVASWRPDQVVVLDEAMLRLAFHTITRIMFSGGGLGAAEATVRRALPLLVQASIVRAFLPDFVARLPVAVNRRYDRAAADVRAVVDELLRLDAAAPGRSPDLVQMMQQARDPDSGSGMDRRQLTDELINVMIAGTETTGGAMAWLFYELARRPALETRVYQEIVEVVGDRPVEFADLARLELTQRVMSEVLRQRATWLSTRRALRPVTLAGITVPAGTEFAFSLYALHHDPALYPRPDEFDVDRWLPEVVATRPRGSFIPFLDGVRKCLGHSFAWTEMAVVLATVIRTWRLSPTPGLRVREIPLSTIRPSPVTVVPARRPAGS